MMPGAPPPGLMTPVSAAQASPNLGAASAAAGKVKQALMILEQSLPELQMNPDLHKAVLTAVNALSKHAPDMAHGAGPGLQQSMMRDMAQRQQTMAPMIAQMQGAGGPPGGGAPAGAEAG